MNAAARRTDAGFSLVEVMIATTVILVAIWASIGAQSYVTGMMNETVANSQLQEAARFGLKEVTHETRWCDATALILSTANGSSRDESEACRDSGHAERRGRRLQRGDSVAGQLEGVRCTRLAYARTAA